jgi:NADH-quinone oxidoreductase subunit F
MKLDQVCFRTSHLTPSWTMEAYRSVGGYQVLESVHVVNLILKLRPDRF